MAICTPEFQNSNFTRVVDKGGGGEFNVSISCSEFSGGRGAVLLRQLCLRDDCYRFSI